MAQRWRSHELLPKTLSNSTKKPRAMIKDKSKKAKKLMKKAKKIMKKAKKMMKKANKKEKGSNTKVDRRDTPPPSPFST